MTKILYDGVAEDWDTSRDPILQGMNLNPNGTLDPSAHLIDQFLTEALKQRAHIVFFVAESAGKLLFIQKKASGLIFSERKLCNTHEEMMRLMIIGNSSFNRELKETTTAVFKHRPEEMAKAQFDFFPAETKPRVEIVIQYI